MSSTQLPSKWWTATKQRMPFSVLYIEQDSAGPQCGPVLKSPTVSLNMIIMGWGWVSWPTLGATGSLHIHSERHWGVTTIIASNLESQPSGSPSWPTFPLRPEYFLTQGPAENLPRLPITFRVKFHSHSTLTRGRGPWGAGSACLQLASGDNSTLLTFQGRLQKPHSWKMVSLSWGVSKSRKCYHKFMILRNHNKQRGTYG